MMEQLKSELIAMVLENKMVILMGAQFLIHKWFSYYAFANKISFKGYVRFVVGKPENKKVADEPKA